MTKGAAGRDYSHVTTKNLLKIQWKLIRAHAGCPYLKPCQFHDRDLRAIAIELQKRREP